jgi:hypothetical protein
VLAAVAISTLFLASSTAQPTQPNPAAPGEVKQGPAINYRERPRYPFDSQRLRGRPIVDGRLAENEWSPLYTVSDGPVKGTSYVNWDDDFLYLAARTDTPGYVVFDVDASGDGWLRGSDNLEIVVAPVTANGPGAITVRLLDAASNKDAPVWNEKVVDPASLKYAAKDAGAGQIVEIAIPRGLAGLRPRASSVLSVRADFTTAAPEKTAPYEPHLLVDITLVEERAVGAPGIAPRLILEDKKLTPGQTLKATLEVRNQVDEPRTIRSVSWEGEGAAAEILKSVREVNLPPLGPQKTVKLGFSSTLPDTAIPGFYQLTVSATLDNGATITNTVSFSIAEAFTVDIALKDDQIVVNGPTEARVWVDLGSAVHGNASPEVDLVVDSPLLVKGRSKKTVQVDKEDGTERITYFVTVPSSTPTGEYGFKATVTWRGKTWTTQRKVRVNRANETAPPPKKDN